MLFISKNEQNHFRILIAIVLSAGIFHLLLFPQKHFVKDAIPEGQNHIEVNISNENSIELSNIKQSGKTSPDKVFLNESSQEELICCPGIGRQKAHTIIKERQIKPFYDWRDFQNRVKISNIQIQVLQDAGVKLNSPQKVDSRQ